jgi:PAS domain S-box-containing protein
MQTVQENLQNQIEENQKIQQELAKEKYLMDALMNNVPEFIYFKDLESKFIKNSKSHVRAFGLESPEQLYGKSDFDFFDVEHAKPAFEDEQKIIRTGKPLINLIEKEVKKDGRISYVSTTKLPLYNEKNEIIGTFGISKNITELKEYELATNRLAEELKTREKEMQATIKKLEEDKAALQKRISEIEKNKK